MQKERYFALNESATGVLSPGSWSDPLVGFCRLQEEEMAGECGAMLTSSSASHLVSPTLFRQQRCRCRNVPLRGRRVSGIFCYL